MTTASVLSCDLPALEHCRDITRREARNFYYGLKLLPEPQRSALYCIYSWMRQADDLADDEPGRSNPAVAAERLSDFREDTHQAIQGSLKSSDPMWQAFQATVVHFGLKATSFDEMIDGQIADLQFQQPDTMEDLVAYCRQVASSVGRVCISIWGFDDPHALDLADDRGIAFQLTNILRDIREDHENGRVYLPASLLDSCGLDMDELLGWKKPDCCESLIRQLVEYGQEHYRSSAALDGMITRSCRPTLRAMTRIYHGLLRRIERNPRSIAGAKRVRLGSLHKISIALSARVQAGVS
ncbi:MAG: phytoene/squalene synthase family protein [Phycisphaerales bacterium]|nr:phytoene/squalene synthase family protein [Phycisphaerales bacterium]